MYSRGQRIHEMALNKQQRNKLSKPLTNKQTEGIKIVAANSNIAQEENQRLREQLKQYEIMMHKPRITVCVTILYMGLSQTVVVSSPGLYRCPSLMTSMSACLCPSGPQQCRCRRTNDQLSVITLRRSTRHIGTVFGRCSICKGWHKWASWWRGRFRDGEYCGG